MSKDLQLMIARDEAADTLMLRQLPRVCIHS